MYTNLLDHGGDFRTVLDAEFDAAENVTVASGYVSLDIINAYQPNFIKIAESGGIAKLLLGMALYEGLGERKLEAVSSLNEQLLTFENLSGVYIANGRRYHGKVYRFYNENESTIYVGSSNFSSSGTQGNIECTVPVVNENQKQEIINFLDDLYSSEYAVTIDKTKITVPGKKRLIKKSIENYWGSINKYDPASISTEGLPKIEIPLDRLDEKEKSNLNIYFGKGRLNTATGIITPRPWYEIEIIASNDINSQESYPKGNFRAFTDDGYIIPMRTQGDNKKNIRSRKTLQIFGIWLKGKLEKSGALEKFHPVTKDTLAEYGTNQLKLYKIEEGKYYMEF